MSWECITGDIASDVNYRKYLSKLELRLDMDEGSSVKAYISYDGSEDWHLAGEVTGGNRLAAIPVFPVRCESFRLRLSGVGGCRIVSAVTTETTCGENR